METRGRIVVALVMLVGLGCSAVPDPGGEAVREALGGDWNQNFNFRWSWDDTWDPLGGAALGEPAITRCDDGSVDVFVRGTDDAVYQRHWNGQSWSGFAALGNGGAPLGGLAATAIGNHIWIFGTQIGSGNLVTRSWNGSSWGAWLNLGGRSVGNPSALAYRAHDFLGLSEQVVVVTHNQASELFAIQALVGGAWWVDWRDLGGRSDADAAMVSWGPDRLDVVVKGTNNEVFHTVWDGSWRGAWEDLGGWAASPPAMTSWGPNRLDIVVDWGDLGSVRHLAWNGASWIGWESLGGQAWADNLHPYGARPVIVAPWPGSLDVLIQGTDRAMYQTSQDQGAPWSGWSPLASCFQTHGAAAAVSDGNGTMDLVVLDHDRAIWHDRFAWNYLGDGGPAPAACSCGHNGEECCFEENCGGPGSFSQCTVAVAGGFEPWFHCEPCGGNGQPACGFLGCQSGLAPVISNDLGESICGPPCASGVGAPCCHGQDDYLEHDCGHASETLLACAPSPTYPTGQCVSCGHPGEDCCKYWYLPDLGGVCQGGSSCHARPGGGTPRCTLDHPTHCGKLFEPCCNQGALCQLGEGVCSIGYCVAPPSPVNLAPDLAPGSPLTVDPTIVHADEPFTLKWLTCNVGTGPTDDGFSDSVWVDGNQVDVESQDRLAPAGCANASYTFADGLSAGHHQIIVYIDAFQMVDESREDNNSPEWDLFVQ